MKFDAAKFIAQLEGLGASFEGIRFQDGSGRIFPKFKPGAARAQIEALWKKHVEPFPDRKKAIVEILIKRSR